LNFLVFGNSCLELREGGFGKVLQLKPTPAKYTRRGSDLEIY
jgi:hypothetical protein